VPGVAIFGTLVAIVRPGSAIDDPGIAIVRPGFS
jgi:hypothetical protein